jgi:hypothetical protein
LVFIKKWSVYIDTTMSQPTGIDIDIAPAPAPAPASAPAPANIHRIIPFAPNRNAGRSLTATVGQATVTLYDRRHSIQTRNALDQRISVPGVLVVKNVLLNGGDGALGDFNHLLDELRDWAAQSGFRWFVGNTMDDDCRHRRRRRRFYAIVLEPPPLLSQHRESLAAHGFLPLTADSTARYVCLLDGAADKLVFCD